ncbi:hypothetical protein AAGW05_17885 [Arthrobacter sp. LAPM80]|uniref:hypothetical protein n=1 Tax=Arthrobacter sp. LAPM80 TaxID=3141788 RepID=UPI00398B9777
MNHTTVLLIGASRELSLAIAQESLHKGAHDVATVAGNARTALHEFQTDPAGRLEIETVEITDQAQLTELRNRLAERQRVMNPSSTVGEQNPAAMGTAAPELLFLRMASEKFPTLNIDLSASLIARGSGELAGPFLVVGGTEQKAADGRR